MHWKKKLLTIEQFPKIYMFIVCGTINQGTLKVPFFYFLCGKGVFQTNGSGNVLRQVIVIVIKSVALCGGNTLSYDFIPCETC